MDNVDPLLDPRLRGPLPAGIPEDRNRGGVLPPSERGEDVARDEYMDELEDQPSRPLTREEKEAAKQDPGRPAHREEIPER